MTRGTVWWLGHRAHRWAASDQDDEANEPVCQAQPGPCRGAEKGHGHRQLGERPAAGRQNPPQQKPQGGGIQKDDKRDKGAAGRHKGPFQGVRVRDAVRGSSAGGVAAGFVSTMADR